MRKWESNAHWKCKNEIRAATRLKHESSRKIQQKRANSITIIHKQILKHKHVSSKSKNSKFRIFIAKKRYIRKFGAKIIVVESHKNYTISSKRINRLKKVYVMN